MSVAFLLDVFAFKRSFILDLNLSFSSEQMRFSRLCPDFSGSTVNSGSIDVSDVDMLYPLATDH